MRPGKKISWLVLATGTLVVVVWLLVRTEEDPVYQGQRLSVWFEQFHRSHTRKASQEVFVNAGPAAVPFLINRLNYHDSLWRRTYSKFYAFCTSRNSTWVGARLPPPQPDLSGMIRANAACLLGLLGDAAKPAVPDLANALGDEAACFFAAQALGNLGPAARGELPTMLEIVRLPHRHVADTAASAISRVGRGAPEIIPPLVGMLREEDAVKVRVLRILGALGPAVAPAEVPVKELLASTNGNVRFAAVSALWDIVPVQRAELTPRLEEFVRSQIGTTREGAGRMLVRMQPLSPAAAALLAQVARDASDSFCWSAFTSQGRQGRDASNAVPVLVAALSNANPRIAAKAAAVLGDVAGSEEHTLKALDRARRHEYLMVRDAASEAIRKIQPKPD